MTQRLAIIRDLQSCASKYSVGMPFRERRSLSLRVKRLYAELDALSEGELCREV